MKDLFERSVPMQETAQTKKGLLWILELLVFVAVFLVASICAGICHSADAAGYAVFRQSIYGGSCKWRCCKTNGSEYGSNPASDGIRRVYDRYVAF